MINKIGFLDEVKSFKYRFKCGIYETVQLTDRFFIICGTKNKPYINSLLRNINKNLSVGDGNIIMITNLQVSHFDNLKKLKEFFHNIAYNDSNDLITGLRILHSLNSN